MRLILGAHAQRGFYGSWHVSCVGSHISPLERPEITVTYSAGNGSKKMYGVFSETAQLQPLKAMCTVGHFPSESAHAYYRVLITVSTVYVVLSIL